MFFHVNLDLTFFVFLRSPAGLDQGPHQRSALRGPGRVQAPEEEDSSDQGCSLPTPSRSR